MISNNFCLLVHFTCFSNQSPENGVCPYCVADEKEFLIEYTTEGTTIELFPYSD